MSQEKKSISEKLAENEAALLKNPTDAALLKEKAVLEQKKVVEDWLNEIKNSAAEKAEELGQIFNCIVTPAVYVLKELEDVAVAFIKKPDTKQSFKLLRALGENFENGLELAARAQLIRDSDMVARGLQGSTSDIRFMDANGNYAAEYSDLNLSLLFEMQGLVRPLSNEFKKK